MPSGDTRYQARFETPEFLERGRNNPIKCPVHAGASALVAPASGTVSVFDASGAVVVDAQAVAIVGSQATYTVLSAALDDKPFGAGWRVEWALVIAGATHVFRNEALLCRRLLYPPVTEADLLRRHHDLGNLRESSRASYQDEIDEAWVEIQNAIVEQGNRPNLIMSPAALRRHMMTRTLGIIYRGFHHGTGDVKYLEAARDYEKQAADAWDTISWVYDRDEDGHDADSGGRRVGRPVLSLSSPKPGRVSW
jgi:hypothetical protein